ncbi:MAG: GAF domain-containing sensor histidine kinase [Thainema sp.]
MKTVAAGQNLQSIQPAVALLGQALRVQSVYVVLEDSQHLTTSPPSQRCVQWHSTTDRKVDDIPDASIVAGLAMVRQMIGQIGRSNNASGSASNPEIARGQAASPSISYSDVANFEITLSSCQLDADVFMNTSASTAIALSAPVQITPTRQAQFILVRSTPSNWSQAELKQAQELLVPTVATLTQLLNQRTCEQRIHQQQLVYQLAQSISNTTEIDHIFAIALDGLGQSLALQHASILLLKYSQPVLQQSLSDFTNIRFRLAHTWSAEATYSSSSNPIPPNAARTASGYNSPMFPVSKCNIIQQAIQVAPRSLAVQSRQATPIQSAHLASHSATELQAQPADQTVQLNPVEDLYFQHWYQDQMDSALLITPIENRGKILGFIVLHDLGARSWHDDECALVETVATQLSGAILQVQTLRQVQSMVEKRTAQLERSIEVQGKLYEQTRRQIDQLRRLNQLKDDFLSTISHELLTPLTSMRLAARMLRQTDLPPERRQAYLDILEQQCSQETDLINDLLALQSIESQPLQAELQEINLNAYVQDIIRANRPLWDTKNVELQVDLPEQPLVMRTDVTSLHRVLRELLTNASKYSQRGQAIYLQIQPISIDDVAVMNLTLTNRGTGIPAEELPYVFEKFRRGQAALKQAIQGTGLGLALVHCLVQQLNGKITVESTVITDDLWETTFKLNIPLIHQPQASSIA